MPTAALPATILLQVALESVPATANQLGRIEIAVAPSNPNVIYAQVQSIAWNNNAGCGNTNGCQLGVWSSTDGGDSWAFMAGSAGRFAQELPGGNTSGNPGDYPQNWYNQGMAVDPNNPDRVFIDTVRHMVRDSHRHIAV